MNVSRLFCVSCLLAGLLLQPMGARGQEPIAPGKDDSSIDVICGPRCVQRILRYFGKPEEELYDIVREIQWPDTEAGATLLSVATALERQGVRTYAMKMPRTSELAWPHPVIMHIDGDSRGGHYILWYPPTADGLHRVWTGPEGWVKGPWEEVTRGRTGSVLLTAPSPITHPEVAVKAAVPKHFRAMLWLATAAALPVAAWRILRSRVAGRTTNVMAPSPQVSVSEASEVPNSRED